MKAKTFTPMGSMHPVIFFAVVYLIALLFSIFICSTLFYSCNASPAKVSGPSNAPVVQPDGNLVQMVSR